MGLIWGDKVAETSTTTGTGAFTLAGALTGYRAFSSVCSTGDMVYYTITAVTAGQPSGEWETGLGTYSASNTLTRTRVFSSSNANAAVNFSAGTKRVTLSQIAGTLPCRVVPLWSDFATELDSNQSYVDLLDTPDGMMMHVGTGGAGTVIRSRLKAAPSTPYSVIFQMELLSDSTTTDGAGLIIRDSSAGQLIKFGKQFTTNGGQAVIERWNSNTSYSSTTTSVTGVGRINWYKFTDDGVDHKFYTSIVNGGWGELLSQSRTAWVPDPDQIGFGIEDQALSNYWMLIQHYEEQ